MRKSGFTLIELLVVVAIMGLLGTAAVGGYRQMQRGMEESGVVDNATQFIKLAAERAQIDRLPTAVLFWNELLREADSDGLESEIVVGRAVAVRMKGRISAKKGNCLIDEFGDLEQRDDDGSFIDAPSKPSYSRLYLMDKLQNGLKYSVVRDTPQTPSGSSDDGVTEIYLSSDPLNDSSITISGAKGKIIQYGYYVDGSGSTASLGDWHVGSAYGMEFQSFQLPHGYIFESQLPTSMSSPIKYVKTIVFDADSGNATGAAVGSSTITIYSLRPGQSGELSAQKVRTTTAPDVQLNNN